MDLHPHEIRVLKALEKESTPRQVAEKAGLDVDAVNRAYSWLSTKNLVEVSQEIREKITLGPEGVEYAEKGLPERRLLDLLDEDGVEIKELKESVEEDEFKIGFGWLRRKAMASIQDGVVKPLNKAETLDEKLLHLLSEKESIYAGDLDPGLVKALEDLKTRKNVVEVEEEKSTTLKPTKKGLKTASHIKVDERLGQLTPRDLKTGVWRKKGMRPYQVDVYQEPDRPVRIHPLSREIRRVRRIFTYMGFREVEGPLVESAFWNFDALFQPQDHPARDMHDTFYLENPDSIEIPGFKKYAGEIKKVHEDGGETDSTGWGYEWSRETARKPLLRTHTTAVTARELGEAAEEDMPLKVFSVGKVFRNEAVDYKHLPEFYQVEGIVADPTVNFKQLLGILGEFYTKMGFDRIRFRPGYFPYTEMSVEPEVYFKEKEEWIELGGAGIFRPEVVKPLLGVDVPVLAWGLGLDRVVTLKHGLTDIRQLYISDLDWLKEN